MRAAILFFGAVGKLTGKFELEGQLYREGQYVNYRAVHAAIQKHIIEANPDWSFDFYIHGWNQDLQQDLVDLYNPVKYRFDDNTQFNSIINEKIRVSKGEPRMFSLVSLSLSMKFSAELVTDDYDLCVVLRPDILFWKNMNLNEYDRDAITIDKYQDYRGEMHFVMNSNNLRKFGMLFDSISEKLPAQQHLLFKNFLFSLGVPIKEDSFVAGEDEAPLRYIWTSMIESHKLSVDVLERYGITEEEARKYTVIY